MSPKGYGFVDYELYMTNGWFEAGHEQLRKKWGGVLSNVKFQTQNELLLNMIKKISDSGKFPVKYVDVDSAYGNDDHFLDSLSEQWIYFADIPGDRKVFLSHPDISIPPHTGRGRKPTSMKAKFPPQQVKKIVADLNMPWTRVVLGIGAKEPVIAEKKSRCSVKCFRNHYNNRRGIFSW